MTDNQNDELIHARIKREEERLSHFINFMVYSYFRSYMDAKRVTVLETEEIDSILGNLADSVKSTITDNSMFSNYLYSVFTDFHENNYGDDEDFKQKYIEVSIEIDKIIERIMIRRFRKLMKMEVTKEEIDYNVLSESTQLRDWTND